MRHLPGSPDLSGTRRTASSMGTRAFRARRITAISRIAACVLAASAIIGGHVHAARFTLDADLRPIAASADGRYTVDATARFTPEARSGDRRFTVKQVNTPNGGCDPTPIDALFGNGFEDP